MSKARVFLREPGQGFQSTPFGLFDLNVAPPPPEGEYASGIANRATQAPTPVQQPLPVATSDPVQIVAKAPVAPVTPVAPVAPVTNVTSPRAVIASAKARVKELKTELKRMKALQRELAELERLLKAAREKPSASVRPIRRVG